MVGGEDVKEACVPSLDSLQFSTSEDYRHGEALDIIKYMKKPLSLCWLGFVFRPSVTQQ